jgi:hypothetical protein
MTAITISRGLRKLEFDSMRRAPEECAEACVEFALDAPLPPGESVRIPLGMRGGKLRVLVGIPLLLQKRSMESAPREYLYRVTGSISEAAPD